MIRFKINCIKRQIWSFGEQSPASRSTNETAPTPSPVLYYYKRMPSNPAWKHGNNFT